MIPRIQKELELLRRYYPRAEWHEADPGGWVRIPDLPLPPGVWNKDKVTVCFQVQAGYPGAAPYAFYVEGGLRLIGTDTKPGSYEEPSATLFPGTWGKFSWAHADSWVPTEDLISGSNLTNFVQSFADRLRERS